jgi:Putative lumazine-binding
MIAATEAGLGLRRSDHFKGVEVKVFAITGDIATAQAIAGEWIDYLHLVHDSEGWRIVNCLYSANIIPQVLK